MAGQHLICDRNNIAIAITKKRDGFVLSIHGSRLHDSNVICVDTQEMDENIDRKRADYRPFFRKPSLDRLFSPEDLDQVVMISVGGSWIVLSAVLLLCAGATAWSITTRLPTTAAGNGMTVRIGGGLLNVTSRGGGVVRSIEVAVGDRVKAHQVVGRIAQPSLAAKIRALTDELDQLRVKLHRDLQLKTDAQRLRLAAIAQQRTNAERAIEELVEQARVAGEQVSLTQHWSSRGLVANQQVLVEQRQVVAVNREAETRRADLKQLDVQDFEVRSQVLALEAEIAFQIASRDRAIAAARHELTLQETVTTPYDGEVLELKVTPGGTVADNTPILSIQPDTHVLEVLAYMPSRQAKGIRNGMAARVVPSTVKREEYGHMRGRVTFVADYPATSAAVMRNFQNEQLVLSLTSSGPITEVRVALDLDPQTTSGFSWSSPGGPPLKISAGTFASIEVVTETRAPITLVLPFLRQTLGF
jgi:HlyD family secretion protein